MITFKEILKRDVFHSVKKYSHENIAPAMVESRLEQAGSRLVARDEKRTGFI